ncbi:MAG: hypothetical protein GWP04_10135 [Gammaproteobacteria bacterium]|nr:hypothetical protein [Gammaproteobacteria bacterium]
MARTLGDVPYLFAGEADKVAVAVLELKESVVGVAFSHMFVSAATLLYRQKCRVSANTAYLPANKIHRPGDSRLTTWCAYTPFVGLLLLT